MKKFRADFAVKTNLHNTVEKIGQTVYYTQKIEKDPKTEIKWFDDSKLLKKS